MQMGLGEQVQWSIYREENPLSYGTFGWALQEILGVNPERDFGLTVEHTDFIQTDLGKEDYYRSVSQAFLGRAPAFFNHSLTTRSAW
jgi:hypothetical protein